MIELPAVEVQASQDGVFVKMPYHARAAWDNLLEWMTVNRCFSLYLKVDKPKRPRTTGYRSQSHHFNGHVQQLANETGDYFDDMKMNIKRKAISKGYPSRTNAFGDAVPISEADASTVECAMLIDTAHEVASFLDVRLKEYE
jgi:hypothetical protein